MRAKSVYESASFFRGEDPKKSMSIGHAHLYPQKWLFIDMHKYCKESTSEEFKSVTPIYWEEDDKSGRTGESHFIVYMRDRILPNEDANFYTVYLTKDEGVLAFHEYYDPEGIWRKTEHKIHSLQFWRDLLEAHHGILYESISFQRGADPKRAMGIGLSPEVLWDRLGPDQTFVLKKDIPAFGYEKDLLIAVVDVKNIEGRNKQIRYIKLSPSEDEKKKKGTVIPDYWVWTPEFFAESVERIK